MLLQPAHRRLENMHKRDNIAYLIDSWPPMSMCMIVVRSSCLAERGELQDTIVGGLGGLRLAGSSRAYWRLPRIDIAIQMPKSRQWEFIFNNWQGCVHCRGKWQLLSCCAGNHFEHNGKSFLQSFWHHCLHSHLITQLNGMHSRQLLLSALERRNELTATLIEANRLCGGQDQKRF